MKKYLSFLVLVIIVALCASPALATGFTFDQIVGIISACKIDTNQIFSDGREITLDPSKVPGPILIWFADQASGMFIIPKTNSHDGYAWYEVNKAYLGYCMDFLIPTLSNYVDYDHGAYITFRITRMTDAEDFAVLEYSPKLKNAENKAYGSTFSDADMFCQETKRYAELINK